MVVRLYGKVNGAAVEFELDGGRWKAIVPSDIEGVYICELTAVDDAGNTTFSVKYLLTFDPTARCVKLQKCIWQTELQSSIQTELYGDSEFVAVLLNHGDKDGSYIRLWGKENCQNTCQEFKE